MGKKSELPAQLSVVFTESEVDNFENTLLEKARELGIIDRQTTSLPNDLIVTKIRDRRNPSFEYAQIAHEQIISSKYLLTSLARIIIPVEGDKCACIKVEGEKILWSSNNILANRHPEVERTVKLLCKLAGEQTSEDEKKEFRRELLEGAILKDSNSCRKPGVKREYKSVLGANDRQLWDYFEDSFIALSEQSLTERNLTAPGGGPGQGQSREQLMKDALGRRQTLVRALVQIRSKNRGNLPYRLFKVLFNVTDLLIILKQVEDNTGWWRKISSILRREATERGAGFQVVKGEVEMHAEMKMLEEKSNKSNKSHSIFTKKDARNSMRNFIEEISNPPEDNWFAVTKRLCLFCELSLSACERVSSEHSEEIKKTKVTQVNRGGGIFFKGWVAFGLRDDQLKSDIRSNFRELFLSVLEKVNKKFQEEDCWIEEQVVYINLKEETRDLKPLFFNS